MDKKQFLGYNMPRNICKRSMVMTDEMLIKCALDEGFFKAAVVKTSEIVFDEAFRPYCKENLCGKYGVNYSCPPDCGSPETMKKRVLEHRHALVLQSIWPISDYKDAEAIKKAKGQHNAAGLRLMKRLREEGHQGFMIGSSGCSLCNPCSITEGKPCKFPDLKFSCISAFCIHARKLSESAGMEYDGKETLALFGLYVCD